MAKDSEVSTKIDSLHFGDNLRDVFAFGPDSRRNIYSARDKGDQTALQQFQNLNDQIITPLDSYEQSRPEKVELSQPVSKFPGNMHYLFGDSYSKSANQQQSTNLGHNHNAHSQSHRMHYEVPNLSHDINTLISSLVTNANTEVFENALTLNEPFLDLPEENDNTEDFDKFFSKNESSELEKFLDSLANPTSNDPTDPLKFYKIFDGSAVAKAKQEQNNDGNTLFQSKVPYVIDNDPEVIKQELAEAFGHPLGRKFRNIFDTNTVTSNVTSTSPTASSKDSVLFKLLSIFSTGDKRFSDDSLLPGSPKRRRASSKPLLSSEQKKLNHSHSEQRRRQLCKLAYDRCLSLIVDIDQYNKEADANKLSKRAKMNKYGMPNLSKHTALIMISHEITRLKSKNEELEKLIRT